MKDMLTYINNARTDRKRGKGYHHGYKNIVLAFDIETTTLDNDNAIMYIWQLAYERPGKKPDVITGRTWEDFLIILDEIAAELGAHERVIIWVQNLQFEFSFLKGIMDFSDVFAIRARRVLYAIHDNKIEFRCSYLLTGMSLEKLLEVCDVEFKKLTMDYSIKRYPWTALTENDFDYCIHDVLGLVEAIRIKLDREGDTLATIPYTSTGYIRRDARKNWSKQSYMWRFSIMPSYGLYRLLRDGFRGGNCHANRWIVGMILSMVYSIDRASSYPDVMLTCLFPVSQFYHMGPVPKEKYYYYINKDKAVIMEVKMNNVRLKDQSYPIPYLARFKCRGLKKYTLDNGRILEAEELITTVTDIDFKIIEQQYDFEWEIKDLYYARYGKLPEALTDLIIKDYKEKSSLKGGDKYFYDRAKARVNSYYGLTAQDPVKDNLIFVGGDAVFEFEGRDPYELLDNYNKRGFLPYQIGCWVTAWARYRLEQGIRAVHDNGGTVVYVDTDSVKYIDHNEKIQEAIDLFNSRAEFCARVAGIVGVTPKGEEKPSGVYESEGIYKRFKTLGAKKYVYEDQENNLHITIAGVNKDLGAKELGCIENFKEGFTFHEAGGLEAVYNDAVDYVEVIDGHPVRIRDNVALKPSTYTIGLTRDYKDLLMTLGNEVLFTSVL